MNKIQKIVLTIWFIPSFIVVAIGVFFMFGAEVKYWIEILGAMSIALIVLAIPTFFLYKLWADKK